MSFRLVLIASGLAVAGCGMKAEPSSEPEWPVVDVYRGATPVIDGVISDGEYADAIRIDGVDGWAAQFSPVTDPNDLSVTVWMKHDGDSLYVAYDVTDNVIYGFDIERWNPEENDDPHQMTGEGWPWFGDGVELMVNAENRWLEEDGEGAKGNGLSWQMVASTHKSWLHGVGRGGLMQGEPRTDETAWENFAKWTENGDMVAAVGLKPKEAGRGYVIEWQVKADPCLEVSPGKFWSPELGETRMGLNLAVADLDRPEDSAENWLNIHHENWWSGEKTSEPG